MGDFFTVGSSWNSRFVLLLEISSDGENIWLMVRLCIIFNFISEFSIFFFCLMVKQYNLEDGFQ